MAAKARPWIVGILAAVMFLYALFAIALEPAVTTDLYPKMSTLRADPVGAKALYDSIAEMPGIQVERSFKPVPANIQDAAVILLGYSSKQLREGPLPPGFERTLESSGRVVIAFDPELPEVPNAIPDDLRRQIRKERGLPEDAEKKDAEKKPEQKTRISAKNLLGVELKVHKGVWEERSELGSNARETALYFNPVDPAWTVIARDDKKEPSIIERKWKLGSVMLIALGYPLSNEGLRAQHNTGLVATMIGPFRRVVFSESHLGISSTGSVGSMLRRYGMTGAALMLMLLGLLFIWKMSTSLLPPKHVDDPKRIEGQAAQDGLAFLIRRAIPKQNLLAACWQEWERSVNLRPHIAAARQARAKESLQDADPVRGYKNIQKALTERT